MSSQRGYYSLIQFCPDPSRLEAVNVGVALFCPALGFLDARTTRDNRRAEKLVSQGSLQRKALVSAKLSIERRLRRERSSFADLSDFQKFIDTRASSLRLTPPRAIKVVDPAEELDGLFDELVGGTATRQAPDRDKNLFPSLHNAFKLLESQGKAVFDVRVRVPVLERTLAIPFAYQNGKLNLVKPQRFSKRDEYSVEAAMRLALEGSLLQKHGVNNTEAQLIVVSQFDENAKPETVEKVNSLFEEFQVENIERDELSGFVDKVLLEAH